MYLHKYEYQATVKHALRILIGAHAYRQRPDVAG